jgi:spermidine synthase
VALWFTEAHTPDVRLCIRAERQIFSAESRYQRIEIFQSPQFGRFLTLDGLVMLTERDGFIYHEMMTHPAFAVRPDIRHVLVVGGGDGWAVHELIRYNGVERIDVVELDEMVVHAARGHLMHAASAFDDSRVRLFIQDGVAFVRRCRGEYDLIVVDSTGPVGPGEGLFTREFLGCCFSALKEDGILLSQMGSPYYEKSMDFVARTFSRAKKCFPIVRAYQAHVPTYPSGYWLFGFLSKKYDPVRDLQAGRWQSIGIKTRYYNTPLHLGAFALPSYINARLGIAPDMPRGEGFAPTQAKRSEKFTTPRDEEATPAQEVPDEVFSPCEKQNDGISQKRNEQGESTAPPEQNRGEDFVPPSDEQEEDFAPTQDEQGEDHVPPL